MKFFKKYWYLLILTIITLGMGVVAFITSGKLTNKETVAPSVPQEKPQASENACTLSFAIATPTPTTPVDDTPIPTATDEPQPSNTPTNTPTNQPTATETQAPTATPPPVACNYSCTTNANCVSGLICSDGFCRNPNCTGYTDCVCPAATATPTTPPLASCNNTCSVNSDCRSGLLCAGNVCRHPNCVEQPSCTCPGAPTATPSPTPNLASCNNNCSVNADCAGSLVCSEGMCRNAGCTEKTNCTCTVAQATPQTPITGTGPSFLGISVIGGALLLILLGLAL